MQIRTRSLRITAGFIAFYLLNVSNGFSAGLEKDILWSGHYAGLAGAASAVVEGPESLFFNPAGLAKSSGLQVSGNLSPTISKFSAPIADPLNGNIVNSSLSSNSSFFPPGAALISYGITPRLGVGLGYYVSGGTRAIYNSVNFGPQFSALTPNLESDITITEFSLGTGYEILDGLRIGAAYRIVMIHGTLAFAQPQLTPGFGVNGLAATTIDGLSDTRYNGFKLGIQYAPKDSVWGLGAQWRSEVQLNASGTSSGQFLAPGGTTPLSLSGSPTTVGATFPQQISIGGFYDLIPKTWRLLAEYTWTEYHTDQTLNLGGTLGTTPLPSRPLNWSNMSNVRVATEYKALQNLALRAGYIFTSQVTPNSTASPIFSSPGSGHTFVLGAGMNFLDTLQGDIALEYSHASGTVTAADSASGGGFSVPGDYTSNAYAAHLGVTYRIL